MLLFLITGINQLIVSIVLGVFVYKIYHCGQNNDSFYIEKQF